MAKSNVSRYEKSRFYDSYLPHDLENTAHDAQRYNTEDARRVVQTQLCPRFVRVRCTINCSQTPSVLIDLFIRLGYITPDNEPDFMKILTRLHGTFDFERW